MTARQITPAKIKEGAPAGMCNKLIIFGAMAYCIQKVLDIEIEEAIAQLTTIPRKFGISHRPTEKEFYLEDERQGRISFTTSAIHFSNEAVCALNTGDMQGIYCLGENAQICVAKVTVQ